jgi:hypothetical protein
MASPPLTAGSQNAGGGDDALPGGAPRRRESAPEPDLQHAVEADGELAETPRLVLVEGERLLAQHVQTGAQRGVDDRVVRRRRGGDDAPFEPGVRERVLHRCVRRGLRAHVGGELTIRRVRFGESDHVDVVHVTEGREMEAPHPAETDEHDGQGSGHVPSVADPSDAAITEPEVGPSTRAPPASE